MCAVLPYALTKFTEEGGERAVLRDLDIVRALDPSPLVVQIFPGASETERARTMHVLCVVVNGTVKDDIAEDPVDRFEIVIDAGGPSVVVIEEVYGR